MQPGLLAAARPSVCQLPPGHLWGAVGSCFGKSQFQSLNGQKYNFYWLVLQLSHQPSQPVLSSIQNYLKKSLTPIVLGLKFKI